MKLYKMVQQMKLYKMVQQMKLYKTAQQMSMPLFVNIKKNGQGCFQCMPPPNQNPYLYKYRLRVFWRGSRNQGDAFLRDKRNVLCLHDGWLLVDQIIKQGEPCYLYYTARQLRADYSEKGLIAKIDRDSPRWKHIDFNDLAPAFDDDTDPVAQGLK